MVFKLERQGQMVEGNKGLSLKSDIKAHKKVEVKRTVPREDAQGSRGVSRTKKIFVGGIPLTLTEGSKHINVWMSMDVEIKWAEPKRAGGDFSYDNNGYGGGYRGGSVGLYPGYGRYGYGYGYDGPMYGGGGYAGVDYGKGVDLFVT
uniref:RNA-binding protein squid-like n=1 Tax=Erigeron canadensis TaxID=72917 RepID=UPI001CB8CCD2|nr:RNA-binding protein squid-like [Erigeron canadensis]